MNYHIPVMLKEAVDALNVVKNRLYVDATLGDGGYSLEILKRGGKVVGVDYDKESLQRATERVAQEGLSENFIGILGNFKHLTKLLGEQEINAVNGIVYDLGYSSYQLDSGYKGLSFLKEGPLDMRLSEEVAVTALDLINFLSEKQLADLIREYSDERLAGRFARAIIEARDLKKLQTTVQLAQVLKSAAPSGYENGRIHPATRTFQALRMVVNDEIGNLKLSLPQAAHSLLPGARLVVISFQSKEDQLVKRFGQSAQPNIIGAPVTLKVVTKKPLMPSDEEVQSNPRARSAKMRVFEKC